MDPLEHEDIKAILALTQENNQMLHKIRRDAAWGKFWSIIKVIIFIAPFIYAYYYLSPYIEKVNSMYQSTENVKNFDVQTYLKSLINQETNKK
jgi:Sec-independent protein secretion pathway component TatC